MPHVRRLVTVVLCSLLMGLPGRMAAQNVGPIGSGPGDGTATGTVASCVYKATEVAAQCLEELPTLVEILCTLKWQADVVLCGPATLLGWLTK